MISSRRAVTASLSPATSSRSAAQRDAALSRKWMSASRPDRPEVTAPSTAPRPTNPPPVGVGVLPSASRNACLTPGVAVASATAMVTVPSRIASTGMTTPT
jgi:hypothetical protein